MNIGDRVRLLRGREEGVIVGFGSNNNIVEVEIEDGFRIPALRSEVVVVAAEEAQRFRREEPDPRKIEPRGGAKEVVSIKGIFFAFVVRFSLLIVLGFDASRVRMIMPVWRFFWKCSFSPSRDATNHVPTYVLALLTYDSFTTNL